uniref:Uncharacterized protein n=1 Tax=Strigamia maritima TaxID=126957 RepID=T1JLM3_STRMM
MVPENISTHLFPGSTNKYILFLEVVNPLLSGHYRRGLINDLTAKSQYTLTLALTHHPFAAAIFLDAGSHPLFNYIKCTTWMPNTQFVPTLVSILDSVYMLFLWCLLQVKTWHFSAIINLEQGSYAIFKTLKYCNFYM